MPTNKKRIPFIDICKGIAMILVIMGHCKFLPREMHCIIYSFHMPLFFAASGYTFSTRKKFKDFFVSKLKGFILPYFCLCFILYFFHDILLRGFFKVGRAKAINHIIGIFLGYNTTPYYFSMWFLLVTFVAELILYWIIKSTDKLKFKGVIYIILTLTAPLISFTLVKSGVKGSPWSLHLVPVAIGFITMGYVLRMYSEQLKKLCSWFSFAVLGTANVILSYFNSKKLTVSTGLFGGNFGNYYLFMGAALCGVCAVMILCVKIKNCDFLEYIGKNSIVYYAFQNDLFIPLLSYYILKLNKVAGVSSNELNLIFVVVFSCFGLAIFSEIIKNCIPFVLGKFEKPPVICYLEKAFSKNKKA